MAYEAAEREAHEERQITDFYFRVRELLMQPPCSGWVVTRFGLSALTHGIAIGLLLMLALRLIYRPAHSAKRAHSAVTVRKGLVRSAKSCA